MTATDLLSPVDAAPTAASGPDHRWLERIALDLVEPARSAGHTQDRNVYAANYATYFATLDELDTCLDQRRYLLDGARPGAADEALAIALWMHDGVFAPLYKLNRQRLEEFRNLGHYLRDVFSVAGLTERVDLRGLKRAAWLESAEINPKRRVPPGDVQLDYPHDRALRFGTVDGGSDVEGDPGKRVAAGEWKRGVSKHRSRITADGSSRYPAERGRYHLYVANNCPWCHRTVLARALNGLEDVVSMDVLFYRRDPERGWQFRPDVPGCSEDSLFGYTFIRELYERVGSAEKSVPVLWDRETESIVSNESADIVRMFSEAFGDCTEPGPDLYPVDRRDQIERVNQFTYHAINNGAYKAGFAESQSAYESAYRTFFTALDMLDHMLRGRRFLLGDSITEADLRLFPTIFRFDAVYFTRFALNERMVRDIPSLERWLQTMLAVPEIANASNLEHCCAGYFGRTGNGIVPLGPESAPTVKSGSDTLLADE